MIKLLVIGHVGKDATINTVEGGKTVINFNVAHSSKYKDKQGDMVSKTTWVSCSYWTQSTGIAPYLKKGTQVFVEGEPDTDWYNAAQGIVSQLKLRVFKVELLGSKNQDQGAGGGSTGNSGRTGDNIPNASEVTEPIDDLPF